jgi:hypothetical protein
MERGLRHPGPLKQLMITIDYGLNKEEVAR